jgi:hypothetical protein
VGAFSPVKSGEFLTVVSGTVIALPEDVDRKMPPASTPGDVPHRRYQFMSQPELTRTLDLIEPASAQAAPAHPHEPTADKIMATVPSGTWSHEMRARDAREKHPEPPPYFDRALQDAERLLNYAAESGIDVDSETRNAVLQARSQYTRGVSDQTTANLLTALTKLAARIRPVTAGSLRACANQERHTAHLYMKVAIGLALLIIPCSVFSFVTSAIADAIRKDIVTGNDLAATLAAKLPIHAPSTTLVAGTEADRGSAALPLDVITDLQQFASTIRFIDARAMRLNALTFHTERDPFADRRANADRLREVFQLPIGLPNPPRIAADFIRTYQDVRLFALSLVDDLSFFYGAITSCVLPMLYALLGTCAYLLRSFENGIKTRTFTPDRSNSARFVIAAIGGAVVGLFSNFSITQAASIPPLAIAFLVGYAVDVFFSFLEGLLQTFAKGRSEGVTA